MASDKTKSIVDILKSSAFTIACDGSNDTDYKLYPIVVTFFNPAVDLVQSGVLCIPNLIGDATGKNIGSLILKELERLQVPIENCIAFIADNANVMLGKNKGVLAFLKEKQENLICIGCCCHLINLASEKAASTLPTKVDEMLVDIFYYLQKSVKRKESLKKFQDLYNKEAQKILKHVCTRWLSLGRSLTRLVEQWDPLTSFFKEAVHFEISSIPKSLSFYQIPKKVSVKNSIPSTSNESTVTKKLVLPCKRKLSTVKNQQCKKLITSKQNSVLNREEKIFMFLSSPVDKIYSVFLLSVIPVFEKANTILQTGSPYVHKLKEVLNNLLREIFSKFIKPTALKGKLLLELNYHSTENHKEQTDFVIGNAASDLLPLLTEEETKVFFSCVLNYFITCCNYIVNKFPLQNDTLTHAAVADLSKIDNAKFASIKYFIQLFPFLMSKKENETFNQALDEVENQFCLLQLEDISTITSKYERMDAQWAELRKVKGADGLFKFDRVSDIMLSILLIPHSNAECERVFSIVKKNRNSFRSSLSNKTLESLLIVKTNYMKSCYEQVFTDTFLKNAKKATTNALHT